MLARLFTPALALALCAATASGAVRFVKADAVGANNGTSWANAYTSLQSALTVAASGDEIWVAKGTYKPATPATPSPRSVSFVLKSGVKVLGGFFGSETAANQRNPRLFVSVLSGDINGDDAPNFGNRGDNSFRVVRAINVNSGAILDGFIIRGGNANDPPPSNSGSAVYVSGGSPRVLNCIVRDNFANRAAIQSASSSAVLSQLVVTGNRSDTISGIDIQGAGAVSLSHCTVAANTSLLNSTQAVLFLNTTGGNARGLIVWGNTNPQGLNNQVQIVNGGTAAINASVVQNAPGSLGNGVVSTDPLLISMLGSDGVAGTGDEDLRLKPGSPSIDVLSTGTIDDDYSDQDGDGNTGEAIVFETSWRNRNADDPGTPNTPGNTVEHGAYEFQGTSCAGDIDGNGVVNTNDLPRFLAVFGDSGEPLRTGDFNADGVVDTADLVMLLGNFGSSCV
ncbi:MAG: hypothetical protein J0L61_06835 [Planctomycetes bacterium]|nr:hypothetical protein [Planctomycetota bacterium]